MSQYSHCISNIASNILQHMFCSEDYASDIELHASMCIPLRTPPLMHKAPLPTPPPPEHSLAAPSAQAIPASSWTGNKS
jgi:hypothetical protein